MKTELSFDNVIDRLKKALEIKHDYELAELLNMKKTTFNSRKKAQSLPFEEIFTLASTKKMDFNWLLTGDGTMYREKSGNVTDTHGGKVLELYENLSDSQRREILLALEEKKQFNELIETVNYLQQKVG